MSGSEADSVETRALTMFKAKDFAGAVDLLERTRDNTPLSKRELYILAVSLEQLGRTTEALAAAQSALRKGPGDTALQGEVARLSALAAGTSTVATPSGKPSSSAQPVMNDIFLGRTEEEQRAFRDADLAKRRARERNAVIAPSGILTLSVLALMIIVAGSVLFWFGQVVPNQTTTVPDVRGKLVQEAQQEFQQAGLGVTTVFLRTPGPVIERVKDDTMPEGTVVGSKPGAGEKVIRNTQMTILVADPVGPPGTKVVVPDVVGMDVSTARQTLEAAHIKPAEAPGIDYFGVVTHTDPQAGSEVVAYRFGEPHDTVTLFTGP